MDHEDTWLGSEMHPEDLGSGHQGVTDDKDDIADITNTACQLTSLTNPNSCPTLDKTSSEWSQLRRQDDHIGLKDSSGDEIEDDLVRT